MPKKRIHKDRSTDTRPKTRNRVECNCTLHCNGSKWVDPRTFERHQQEKERFRTITSVPQRDRKSTRLNSSHLVISYAVFCLKKKKKFLNKKPQISYNNAIT